MQYLDFDLEIGLRVGQDYPVTADSPAGQATTTLRLPFDETTLRERLKDLQIALLRSGGDHQRYLSEEERVIQDFGQMLFQTLMVGEISHRYRVSQQIAAQTDGTGLRVRLHIQAPDLAMLPWEFLYDSTDADYLCLAHDTSLVRYLNLSQPIPALEITPPLRILGMIANPRDLPVLNVEREKDRMRRALKSLEQKGLVKLHWLEGDTWEALQEAMFHRGPWHIFHFIGHGGFNTASGEGALSLVNERGKSDVRGTSDVALMLTNQKPLRLVVLNACDGARSNEQDIFSSTAATLARKGIPGVLAMQYAITDPAAIQLTHAFYQALAYGSPVDEAVVAARQAIRLGIRNSLEWGTPVLYLRARDSVVFLVKPPLPPDPPSLSPLELTAQEWQERGDDAFREKRYPKALECYEESIKTDPNFGPAYASKGHTLRMLKRFEEALIAYNQALNQMNYHTAATYSGKGIVLIALKRYAEAIDACEHAMHLNPGYIEASIGKGNALKGLKHLEDALLYFDRALEWDPQNIQALTSKIEVLNHLQRYDDILETTKTLTQVAPDNAFGYLRKAEALVYLKRYHEALMAYGQAEHLTPLDASALCNRGLALRSQRRFEEAIGAYREALEREPNNFQAQLGLGETFCELGWRDEALEAMQQAIDLAPNKSQGYRSKALLLMKLQRWDEALACWERLLRILPDDTIVQENREKALEEREKAIPQGTRLNFYLEHSTTVWAVAWSPDGKLIASGSNDNTVHIWEAANRKHLRTYSGHSQPVRAVAWSPDGKLIASGSDDKTAHIWEAANGKRIRSCSGHSALVTTVAWSPSSKLIASGSYDHKVRVWEVVSGRFLFTYSGHSQPVRAVAWSPDGKFIASGSNDKTVQVWEATSERCIYSYSGHSNHISTVAWSPDGAWIASGSSDKTIHVWGAVSGKLLFTYSGHSNHISTVAWSPDGAWIASGSSDGTIHIWEAGSGKLLFTYSRHTSAVQILAWSPSGTRIASGTRDGTIHIWKAR